MGTISQSEEERYQGPIRRRRSRQALPCQGVAHSGKVSILVTTKRNANPLIIKHKMKKRRALVWANKVHAVGVHFTFNFIIFSTIYAF